MSPFRIAILLTLVAFVGLTVIAVRTGSGVGTPPGGPRKTRAELDRDAIVRHLNSLGVPLPAGAEVLDATNDSARDTSLWARVRIRPEDFPSFRGHLIPDHADGRSSAVPLSDLKDIVVYPQPAWWNPEGLPDAKAYWNGLPKVGGTLLIYSESRGELYLHDFSV